MYEQKSVHSYTSGAIEYLPVYFSMNKKILCALLPMIGCHDWQFLLDNKIRILKEVTGSSNRLLYHC